MTVKIIEFTSETKDKIINEQSKLGFRLFEEQLHIEGNFLLFTDEVYEEPRDILKELDAINSRLDNLEAKVIKV